MNTRAVTKGEGAWANPGTPDARAGVGPGVDAANDLQYQLLMRIGREIKAPLGAVIGFAHLMAQDRSDPLGERHRRWVALIEQAAQYMLSMVNESIEAAAADDLRLAAEDEADVALQGLLSEVGAWLCAQASTHGIRVQIEPTQAVARAWPRALRQVLLNLGSNAIKYNRDGGQVRVSVHACDGQVELRVADDGLGMDERMRSQLFQPYNRLGREAGPVEGTGLGLCIVRQLVERMGGRIEVESEPGRGSTFRVMLRAA